MIGLIIALIGIGAYFLYRKNTSLLHTKVDYSFGDPVLKDIKKLVDDHAFTLAESKLRNLSADELTQALDHITLNGNEDILLDWKNEFPDSHLADLALGVFYAHQAWITRGYQYANDTSNDQANAFFEHSEKAQVLLEDIEENDLILAEKYYRLVRLFGSSSQQKQARTAFEKCIKVNPNHFNAHLEYAEFIQPKWGGSLTTIEHFLENMSEDKLVDQVIHLKLVWDSVLVQENLFGGTMEDLKVQAKELLFQIDAEINNSPPQSLHRFVLYNYMTIVAEEFNIRILNRKYDKLKGENFTLYPFGIMN